MKKKCEVRSAIVAQKGEQCPLQWLCQLNWQRKLIPLRISFSDPEVKEISCLKQFIEKINKSHHREMFSFAIIKITYLPVSLSSPPLFLYQQKHLCSCQGHTFKFWTAFHHRSILENAAVLNPPSTLHCWMIHLHWIIVISAQTCSWCSICLFICFYFLMALNHVSFSSSELLVFHSLLSRVFYL